MKYYTFYKENNDFSEILSDPTIKSAFRTKIRWSNYLLLGFSEDKKSENLFGYLILKYGELIKDPINKDYTPIPNVDYQPVKSKKF